MRFARRSALAAALLSIGVATAEPLRSGDYRVTSPQAAAPSAKLWQLRDEELRKYREIMRGLRGVWTPDIDPILALGIHAENAARKRELARRFVRAQHHRLQAELEFQRLVNEEMEAFYGERPQAKNAASAVASSAAADAEKEFLFLFTPLSCGKQCDQLLRRARRRLSDGADKLHIYIKGAIDDDAIRHWALARNIDRHRVFARDITLNHERGEWDALSRRHHFKDEMPQLLVHRGDYWGALE